MKTIFITGSSSGIGRETVKLFSQKGWQVIATMRNTAKGADLAELPNVIIMSLDVTDSAQIADACRTAICQYDIDVVFHNAGYGMKAPMETASEEEIRQLFDTDVIGTMLLVQQFIPYFKKRRHGTILVNSSLAGIIALPLDGVYGAAKRAVTSMCESIYYELKPFHVAVKVLLPGGTKTNFQMPLCVTTGYEKAAENQRQYLMDGNDEFASPEESARNVWLAATDGKDQLHYPLDSVCQKLYSQYMNMPIEEFKKYFYSLLFES